MLPVHGISTASGQTLDRGYPPADLSGPWVAQVRDGPMDVRLLLYKRGSPAWKSDIRACRHLRLKATKQMVTVQEYDAAVHTGSSRRAGLRAQGGQDTSKVAAVFSIVGHDYSVAACDTHFAGAVRQALKNAGTQAQLKWAAILGAGSHWSIMSWSTLPAVVVATTDCAVSSGEAATVEGHQEAGFEVTKSRGRCVLPDGP